MRLFLTGLHVVFTIAGGTCVLISVGMLLKDCSRGQVRTSDELFFDIWFLGVIAGGIICMVVAGLLSDKLNDIP